MKNQRLKPLLAALICIIATIHSFGEKANNRNDGFNYSKPMHGVALGMKINIKKFNFDGDLDHIILVIVRVKNVSDKKIRLVHLPSLKSTCPFRVIGLSGKDIPKTLYQKRLSNLNSQKSMGLMGSKIHPGEFSEYKFNLSKRFDFSLLGTYTVQYTKKINLDYAGKNISFNISSPKIIFSTLPAKPDEKMK